MRAAEDVLAARPRLRDRGLVLTRPAGLRAARSLEQNDKEAA
jgi:hypothetical protein